MRRHGWFAADGSSDILFDTPVGALGRDLAHPRHRSRLAGERNGQRLTRFGVRTRG
jgi:hypothetical protein